MKKPKLTHTPGPWRVETHATAIEVWNHNTFICSTENHQFRTAHSLSEDMPNACLIAAAPELLELLERAIKHSDCYDPNQPEWVQDACSVVNKAKGEK